jgi:pyruvate kinase
MENLFSKLLKQTKNTEVVARVIQGGELKSKKGVNLPNTQNITSSNDEKKILLMLFLPLNKKKIGLHFLL